MRCRTSKYSKADRDAYPEANPDAGQGISPFSPFFTFFLVSNNNLQFKCFWLQCDYHAY
jgi:hypothetical protein